MRYEFNSRVEGAWMYNRIGIWYYQRGYETVSKKVVISSVQNNI